MKHTEEYLQSKEVLKYPKDYDQRDVIDARNFVKGYEQALNVDSVDSRRELLIGVLRDLFPNGDKENHKDYADRYLLAN